VAEPRVHLIGKSGCHLCENAREIVARVCAELGVAWTESDILTDPALARRYGEYVPVTFVDGVQLDFWRVDEAQLRATLAAGD
jgi:hypothetical protein